MMLDHVGLRLTGEGCGINNKSNSHGLTESRRTKAAGAPLQQLIRSTEWAKGAAVVGPDTVVQEQMVEHGWQIAAEDRRGRSRRQCPNARVNGLDAPGKTPKPTVILNLDLENAHGIYGK